MPPRKTAESISLANLARTVDSAIKAAAARHELALERDSLIDRWEIVGRRLRDVADMNQAFRFAQDVTKNVKLPGLKLEPVATRIGREIWVGFVERGRIPRSIGP